MPSVHELQLCLLSVMRAPDLVADALGRLEVSPGHMREVAAAARATYGLDGPVRAEVFDAALGPPRSEHALPPGETGEMLRGSVQRGWVLPLWPAVAFVVNQDARGFAWGIGFQQPAPLPTGEDPLHLAERARPWKVTAEVLLAATAEVRRLEEWSFDLEAELTFRSSDGRTGVWHALFDFGLLQSWVPKGPAPA